MAGLSDASKLALLRLLFQNLAWADVGDAAGLQPSAAPGVFYIALHTADPGDAGNQSTSELSYTGYARVAVVRSTGGWTIVGTDQITNASPVVFPTKADAGTVVAAFYSIGVAASGAGAIITSGATALSIVQNMQPTFEAGALIAQAV